MLIVGIDEVGRGCWAGPLLASAVLLDPARPIAGLKDSKQLSAKRRQELAALIHDQALAVGIGWVWPEAIDSGGITQAVKQAMAAALAAIQVPFDQVIIDGNYNFLDGEPRAQTRIKADASVPAVSAASIVAKVARDRYMAEQAALFPAYGFEKHVGYGTAAHRAALLQYGATPLHRRSFKPVAALY